MTELCVVSRLRLERSVILVALASAACTAAPDRLNAGAPQATTPDLVVDTREALSKIANHAYATSPDFTRISDVFPSLKDPVDIEEWITTSSLQAYAKIGPGLTPPNVSLPPGTIIVRAVSALPDAGGDGTIEKLTLMVKGPAGTDLDIDDWWYAVTDPNGVPLPGADGGPQAGAMTAECHSCHVAQGAANDFLFGVPLQSRPGVDWPTVLASVANQSYASSAAFSPASTQYPSAKDAVDIAEWVSVSAAQSYAELDPAIPDGGGVTLPTGSVIVRAVYPLADAGAGGAVQKLTLMVKGPPGSDPDVGDWSFAVTDPNGVPLPGADGGLQQGLMIDECHQCHRDNRGHSNDFLYGVPAADRP
jgi:hypothetical protein